MYDFQVPRDHKHEMPCDDVLKVYSGLTEREVLRPELETTSPGSQNKCFTKAIKYNERCIKGRRGCPYCR